MLSKLTRSRLKLTIVFSVVVFILSLFPSYIILLAAEIGIFETTAAWSAWGICISTIGLLIGYYVSKETNRPSMVTNTYVNTDFEDQSDPEEIPL